MPYKYRNYICSVCSKEFRSKHPGVRYCSDICRGRDLRGEKHHLYRSGSFTKNGYRIVRGNGRQVLEHRLVMEEYLGRKLQPGEEIHHKDGDRLNNDISNLELCTSRRHHFNRHHSKLFKDETHKQCNVCLVVKPRDQFYPRKGQADPHRTECKECSKSERARYR